MQPASAHECKYFVLMGKAGTADDVCQLCANEPAEKTAGDPETIVHQMEGIFLSSHACVPVDHHRSTVDRLSTRLSTECLHPHKCHQREISSTAEPQIRSSERRTVSDER